MKIQSNIYKVCIVLTACIALFFLLKYINDVIPRYEWQENIAVVSPWYERNSTDVYCDELDIREDLIVATSTDMEGFKDFNCDKTGSTHYFVDNFFEYNCYKEVKETIRVCHRKEKVRTN